MSAFASNLVCSGIGKLSQGTLWSVASNVVNSQFRFFMSAFASNLVCSGIGKIVSRYIIERCFQCCELSI